MRNRSSVLNQNQRDELRVENFVYHIIKANEETPEYLEEVVLSSDTQREFFRGIIAETGQGTQYVFLNSETSTLASYCRNIVEDPDDNFIETSREIADSFLSYHTAGRTSDGVLIVARVTIPVAIERQSLIALIKLDYTPVLRQRRMEDGSARVALEEVMEALSEHKSSVQKRAIIDMGNNFNWNVLAVERKKVGAVLDSEDAISEYFKSFLTVRLKQNDSTITKKIVVECHRWAKNYDGDMDGKTPADIRHTVINLIDACADGELTYDELKERVCRHRDENQAQRILTSFDRHMDEAGFSGITFSPKPASVTNRDRKGEWETDSGIKIIWNGERNPNVLKKERQEDNSYLITIRANDITEKD